jgi:hypothetical protein
MIKQKPVLEVEIAGKRFELNCDSDSPLGSLHDALMQMKGWCVDRMIAAQKEEQDISDAQKAQEEHD